MRADIMTFTADGSVRVTAGWTFHGAEPGNARQELVAGGRSQATVQPARVAILTAIAATAARHKDHPALARLGMDEEAWGHLFRAMIEAESAYRVDALSPKGAYGLGQLMPVTARVLGVDRRDPAQNLEGAARYLVAQMDRFGSAELALAAYNAGPHRVVEHGGVPPYAETRAYVARVAAIYDRLSGGASEAMLRQAATAASGGVPDTMAFTAVELPAAPAARPRSEAQGRPPVVLDLDGSGRAAVSPREARKLPYDEPDDV